MCIVEQWTVQHPDGHAEEQTRIRPCIKGSEDEACKDARYRYLEDRFPPSPAHTRTSSRTDEMEARMIEIAPAGEVIRDVSPQSPRRARPESLRLEWSFHVPFTKREKAKDKDSINQQTPPSTPASQKHRDKGTGYRVERRKKPQSPVLLVHGGTPPPPPPTPPRPGYHYAASDRSSSSRASTQPEQRPRPEHRRSSQLHQWEDYDRDQRQHEEEDAREQRRRRQRQREQEQEQVQRERHQRDEDRAAAEAAADVERVQRVYDRIERARDDLAAEMRASARAAEMERLQHRIAELRAQLPKTVGFSSESSSSSDEQDGADRRESKLPLRSLPAPSRGRGTKKVVVHHPDGRRTERGESKAPKPLEERGNRTLARAVEEQRDNLDGERRRDVSERRDGGGGGGGGEPRIRGGGESRYRRAIMPDSGEGRAADLIAEVARRSRASRRDGGKGKEYVKEPRKRDRRS